MPQSINPKKLLTLSQATKLCDYSQEYLSLRARSGKLKCLKIGSAWMTTPKWLDDYLKKTDQFKKEAEEKRLARSGVEAALLPREHPKMERAWGEPEPILIPITEPRRPNIIEISQKTAQEYEGPDPEFLLTEAAGRPGPILRFPFAAALTIALVFSCFFFNAGLFTNFRRDASDLTVMSYQEMAYAMPQAEGSIGLWAQEIKSNDLGSAIFPLFVRIFETGAAAAMEAVEAPNRIFDEKMPAIFEKVEIKDSATGEIFCSWLENGELKTEKGRCSVF